MLFTSFGFVLFLTIVVFAYYLLPRAAKPVVVLIANIVFYAFSGWQGLICLAVTIVTSWAAGRKIDDLSRLGENPKDANLPDFDPKSYARQIKAAKKKYMLFAVLLNLGILAVCKYTAVSPILPMGISFYTFKAISYVVDAYRSKNSGTATRSLLEIAVFVSYFPEIVQGPISRFSDLRKTLFERQPFQTKEFSLGLRRVLWGYFKKLVIADRLMPAMLLLAADPDKYAGGYVFLAIILYAVTLYADFTGGIDITIGAARMMGVRVSENFNSPYYARSIMDYWRRWHITMGTWFRDYLFYPLNSSKFMTTVTKPFKKLFGAKASVRIHVALVTLILWVTIGVWHGSAWNFVAWGLANGIVIILLQELMPLYKRFEKNTKFAGTAVFHGIQIAFTFFLMAFINAFDIYHGVGEALGAFASVFSKGGFSLLLDGGLDGLAEIGLAVPDVLCAGAGVCLTILVGVISRRTAAAQDAQNAQDFSVRICLMQTAVLFFLTLVFGAYGIGYEAKQFIYNQF
ncbi:alginate O-acetyltransferase [Clostridia bacterium]|nr:alginate O-acetyltransferase [Clostridia bacterium]